ncbi:uncharacterized protein LOC114678402 [Macaca mulatta]
MLAVSGADQSQLQLPGCPEPRRDPPPPRPHLCAPKRPHPDCACACASRARRAGPELLEGRGPPRARSVSLLRRNGASRRRLRYPGTEARAPEGGASRRPTACACALGAPRNARREPWFPDPSRPRVSRSPAAVVVASLLCCRPQT